MTGEQHPIQSSRTDLTPTTGGIHNPIEAIRRAARAPLRHSDDTIARAAWSVIIHPGDTEAGAPNILDDYVADLSRLVRALDAESGAPSSFPLTALDRGDLEAIAEIVQELGQTHAAKAKLPA